MTLLSLVYGQSDSESVYSSPKFCSLSTSLLLAQESHFCAKIAELCYLLHSPKHSSAFQNEEKQNASFPLFFSFKLLKSMKTVLSQSSFRLGWSRDSISATNLLPRVRSIEAWSQSTEISWHTFTETSWLPLNASQFEFRLSLTGSNQSFLAKFGRSRSLLGRWSSVDFCQKFGLDTSPFSQSI